MASNITQEYGYAHVDALRASEVDKLNKLEEEVEGALTDPSISPAQMVTLLQEKRRIIELRSLIAGALTLALKADVEYGR